MDKKFSKRLSQLIPAGGGFDLSFNLGSAGQAGKVVSTVHLTIFAPGGEGKGPIIVKKLSIPSIAATLEEANLIALEDTLSLLGV
jgi:hypothetical protein